MQYAGTSTGRTYRIVIKSLYGKHQGMLMSVVWLLAAFWLGIAIGFGLFAAMQISREQDKRQLRDARHVHRGDDFGFENTNF